jgi:hypothetical protein
LLGQTFTYSRSFDCSGTWTVIGFSTGKALPQIGLKVMVEPTSRL